MRKLGDLPQGMRAVPIEHTGPIQPERFGLGSTRHYRLVRTGPASVILIVEQWDYIEWWRNGATCSAPDARRVDEIRRETV